MAGLIKLHPVQPASMAEAIDHAMEYRGRLPEVWIVKVVRHDRLLVCQPHPEGNFPAPNAVEVLEFNHYFSEYAEPYFRIVFGPGVLVLTEARSCREKTEV